MIFWLSLIYTILFITLNINTSKFLFCVPGGEINGAHDITDHGNSEWSKKNTARAYGETKGNNW